MAHHPASSHCGHQEVIPLGPLRGMPESSHLRGRGVGMDTLSHRCLSAATVASDLPSLGRAGSHSQMLLLVVGSVDGVDLKW